MVERVPGWTPHVERSLKEVLYRFLEEVHCTKAALYLRAPSNGLLLTVRYGFGRSDAPAARLESDSPLVVAASDLGELPLAVNRLEDVPLLGDHLRSVGVARMLLAPLLDDGRLIGLVDARDKGGQQLFEDGDCEQAARIAAAISELVRELGLVRSMASAAVAHVPEEPTMPQPAEPVRAATELLDERALADLVAAAADAVVRDRLHAIAVTVVDGAEAATLVLGAGESDDGHGAAITAHQAKALLGVTGSVAGRAGWPVEWRRVRGIDDPPRCSVIASEVLLQDDEWSLVTSVIAGEGSSRPAQVLDRLGSEVTAANRLSSLRYARRCLARRLLQPGDKRYPDLLVHSVAVSRLAWSMAHGAGLGAEDAELAAIVGLLHDVGMRELDYDRLYRLDRPGPEHRRVYRRHVLTGERIARGVGLEVVADAIRHHHERWDGTGYPGRIAGDEIPLLARMVHVAEVFDVLTSSSSFLAPIPPEQAIATLRAAGGKQFDPEMVQLLARVLT